MIHTRHIYAKASDMAKPIMCAYPHSDHALTLWKCVLICFAKFPSFDIPNQRTDDQCSNTSPSIRSHIYHIISRCTTHGRFPLNYKKLCLICRQYSSSEQPIKIYNRKQTVMMDTTISNFHRSFFIPEIQKLEFRIPRVQILGKNQCGEFCQTAFKRRESFQDVICCSDYSERIVSSFPHQIQS